MKYEASGGPLAAEQLDRLSNGVPGVNDKRLVVLLGKVDVGGKCLLLPAPLPPL